MALPWSFVSKITNSKHQIPNKFQTGSTRNAGAFATLAIVFLFGDNQILVL